MKAHCSAIAVVQVIGADRLLLIQEQSLQWVADIGHIYIFWHICLNPKRWLNDSPEARLLVDTVI